MHNFMLPMEIFPKAKASLLYFVELKLGLHP